LTAIALSEIMKSVVKGVSIMAGSGLKKTTTGAVAYALGPITGINLLIIDRDPFVRFHAVQ